MRREPRHLIAILLLFVTFSGLLTCICEQVSCAGEAPGTHETFAAGHGHDPVRSHDGEAPCSSIPDHSPGDHFCLGDCGCPCHAPLTSPVIAIVYSPLFSALHRDDPFRYNPEVYLSLFVPPDSAA